MKQVINGKLYNTNTAELIGYDDFSNQGDANYWVKSLYQTKKGAYFIYGHGGAFSEFGQSCGTNSTCGGSNIRLVSKEEAFNFCEEHDLISVIEKHFADMIEEG